MWPSYHNDELHKSQRVYFIDEGPLETDKAPGLRRDEKKTVLPV
jgi:hypothetical protein